MIELPKILASSVIRSAHQGNSHGGIYLIDFEAGTSEQVVDWNNPHINWAGRGGDRGVRGLDCYKNKLYAVTAGEIFCFDKEFNILDHYPNKYLSLTHESWRYGNKMWICACGSDSVICFNLDTHEFERSIYHPHPRVQEKPGWFDPNTGEGYPQHPSNPGWFHTDSVLADGDYLYWCGAGADYICRLRLSDDKFDKIQLPVGETHNARLWRDGIIYNKSRESTTYYVVDNKIVNKWVTPVPPRGQMTWSNLPDHIALPGYVRGMILYDDFIITGTSPAAVNVFRLGCDEVLQTISITNDMRNCICGMTILGWQV